MAHQQFQEHVIVGLEASGYSPWFEAMLEEQDADIMAWALGTAAPPERFAGPMIAALRKLDYIRIAK